MPERIATLTELRDYAAKGMTLAEVVTRVETAHGFVKIFDHNPQLMPGQRFRYFVMPLNSKGTPILKLAKGQTI